MITDEQIQVAIAIYKHVLPNTNTAIQDYNKEHDPRFNYIVRYLNSKRQVVAIWVDFPKLTDWQLKILFKRHKEIDQQFFINSTKDFYRVGWKITK